MFDDPPRLKRGDLRPKSDRRWRAEVEGVTDRFRAAFPDIIFDVAWDVRMLNGIAWRERSQRFVRLYGDLVRHRVIGLEAIALLFAHETGHHHGGMPKDHIDAWMTCERQADRWAAQYGVARAWDGDVAEALRIVRAGARQLLAFESSVFSESAYGAEQSADDSPAHASPDARYRFLLRAAQSLARSKPILTGINSDMPLTPM